MIKMTENKVADNKVVLNGATFMVDDDIATKIYNLIKGVSTVSTTTEVHSTEQPKSKSAYLATKNFIPKFEIKKQSSVDGEELYCISRKNGWTRSEKKCMNTSIKALKGITTIKCKTEDGKEYFAWGYKTKATAEKYLATLPSVFTADEINQFAK